MRARCENEDAGTADHDAPGCDEREVEARRLYLQAGAAGHLSVPGADVDDWLAENREHAWSSPIFVKP